MKRIYLLRHAQALPAEGGRDFDRHLSPKGLDDARALGKFMASKFYAPEVVVCSAAVRTRETLKVVSDGFGEDFTGKTGFSDKVYEGHKADYFTMIQNTNDDHGSLLLVGHNPTIYELAGFLSAKGQNAVLERLSQGYQPASLSVINAPIDSWGDINPDECVLEALVSPMDYNAPARPTRWM